MFPGDKTQGQSKKEIISVFVGYQSLHGLDVRRVDGQGFLIPALGLVYVAPQLCYLALHVQHIVGCGEEVGGLLRAGRGLGGLGHANVHLSCRRDMDKPEC